MESWTVLEKVYRSDGKISPWCSDFGHAKVQKFLIHSPTPTLPLPSQTLSKNHFENRRLYLILHKLEAVAGGSRALGLGHFGNTSHMTLSMGGPRKLIPCFFTPHPQTTQPAQVLVFQSPRTFKGWIQHRGFSSCFDFLPIKCLSVSSYFASPTAYTSQEVPGGLGS